MLGPSAKTIAPRKMEFLDGFKNNTCSLVYFLVENIGLRFVASTNITFC